MTQYKNHDEWAKAKIANEKKIHQDKINPEYYKVGGIDTLDYIKAKLSPAQVIGFCKGNIIKYISRADHKNKLEDLKKAQWYLNKLIEDLENGE